MRNTKVTPAISADAVFGFVTALGLAGCGLGVDSFSPASKSVQPSGADPWLGPVPLAQCQPGDKPEANTPTGGLQGQTPWADRLSGRAAQGYNCNLKLIGTFPGSSWASFDSYRNCAYYSDISQSGGTVVVDVSDPSHPVKAAYLTSSAMVQPWESLRVNAERGLLVATTSLSTFVDVYDVSKDCAHPTLLSSTEMSGPAGHEGWFAPDGMTYYMASLTSIAPIDLTDPANPQQLALWDSYGGGTQLIEATIHGGSVSDDGTRAYVCRTSPDDAVLILDTTDIQQRRPTDQDAPVVGQMLLPDNFACQSTYPVTYGGRPYVIQFGELPAQSAGSPAESAKGYPLLPHFCPTFGPTNFSVPHIIDIADEKNPRLVATLMLQVDDPQNCPLVVGDGSTDKPENIVSSGSPIANSGSGVFIYDVHHCSPDRLHDPTILACARFSSGVRVYDIRNPYKPKELAYYNFGTLSPTDPTSDQAIGRPIVRTDLRQIWMATGLRGFQVLQFAEGVWPFPETAKCPPVHDYFFNHYNPGLGCN